MPVVWEIFCLRRVNFPSRFIVFKSFAEKGWYYTCCSLHDNDAASGIYAVGSRLGVILHFIVLPDDKSIHALGIGASRFEVSGGQHYSPLPLPLPKLWWS